jgi:hypothetical protein
MAIEREKGIKITSNVLKKNESNIIHSTIMHFKVSHVILDRHRKERKSMIKTRKSQQLLSSAEEKVLTERIHQFIILQYGI